MNTRPAALAFARHALLLCVGLGLITAIVILGSTQSLARLGQLEPAPTILAFVVTVALTAAVTSRWRILTNALAGRAAAHWRQYYHYFIISRLLGFVLPKDVTDLGSRALCLKRFHRMPLASAGSSVLFDRLFDLRMAGMMLVAVAPFWLGWISAAQGIMTMAAMVMAIGVALLALHQTVVAIPISAMNAAAQVVSRLRRRTPPNRLSTNTLDRNVVLCAYAISVMKFALTAARMVFFCAALGLDVSPWLVVLATPVGQLAYVLAFTPGGLGIFELGWFGILRYAEVTALDAATFVVGQRVLTLLMVGALAALSQLWTSLAPPSTSNSP